MANKKAKYHVKNSSGYDTMLFETILSQVTDSPIKSLERSTAYKANAICSESTLAKGGFLVCTTAGTTAGTVPTAYASAAENATITDGTAKFVVHYFENLATLMSKTAGSATQPIYFNKGVPTATNYSVAKSVPSDAKFTDTVYSHPNSGVTAGTYRNVTVNAQGHVTGGSNPIITVAQGGTGLTSSPSMLINLGSTSAANVLQASPRPGVTGTLPVANGGTGANTVAAAVKALLGSSAIGSSTKPLYYDGAALKACADSIGGGGIVAQLLEQNGYVKFANGLILQWGNSDVTNQDTTVTFPIVFGVLYSVVGVPKSSSVLSGSNSNFGVKRQNNKSFIANMYDSGNGYAGFNWCAFGKA